MGYLTLPDGLPDFNKAVIVFGFNIPAASIAAAHAAVASGSPNNDEWPGGVIPLVTFGRKQSEVSWDKTLVDVMEWMTAPIAPEDGGNPVFNQFVYSGSSTFENYIPPCVIGVDCSGATPRLVVNLQTEATPTIVGYDLFAPSVQGYGSSGEAPGYDLSEGTGWNAVGYPLFCPGATDYSYSEATAPVNLNFKVLDKAITADEWHNVIISFDLSPGIQTHGRPYPDTEYDTADEGTDACCHAWVAIDDTNYNGANNLGPNYVDGGGPNDIVSEEAITIAYSDNSSLFLNVFTPDSTYDAGTLSIPAGSIDLGLPAPVYYSGNIINVRMRELHFYTGVTLDTSVEENRRAFFKDDGNPETDYTIADGLLGKTPEIRLHGASLIKAGVNSGTAGPFTKTGTINTYTE